MKYPYKDEDGREDPAAERERVVRGGSLDNSGPTPTVSAKALTGHWIPVKAGLVVMAMCYNAIYANSSPQSTTTYCSARSSGAFRLAPSGVWLHQFWPAAWANCYLNNFDHFVTRRLGCPAYLRYVDDFAPLPMMRGACGDGAMLSLNGWPVCG